MKKKLLLLFVLILLPCQVLAGQVVDANRLFDWAERSYPQYFGPAGQESFWYENFLLRYYPDTETYIGTLG